MLCDLMALFKQTGACFWFPLYEKIWMFCTYVDLPSDSKNACAGVFSNKTNGVRSHFRMPYWELSRTG